MQYFRLIPISSAQVGTGAEKNNYYNLFWTFVSPNCVVWRHTQCPAPLHCDPGAGAGQDPRPPLAGETRQLIWKNEKSTKNLSTVVCKFARVFVSIHIKRVSILYRAGYQYKLVEQFQTLEDFLVQKSKNFPTFYSLIQY